METPNTMLRLDLEAKNECLLEWTRSVLICLLFNVNKPYSVFTLPDTEINTETHEMAKSSPWHQWQDLVEAWTPSYNSTQAILFSVGVYLNLGLVLGQCESTINEAQLFCRLEKRQTLPWVAIPVLTVAATQAAPMIRTHRIPGHLHGIGGQGHQKKGQNPDRNLELLRSHPSNETGQWGNHVTTCSERR